MVEDREAAAQHIHQRERERDRQRKTKMTLADENAMTEVQLTAAPTSAPNNLSCHGSSLVYVSKNAVSLVEAEAVVGREDVYRPRASGYGNKARSVDAVTWVPTPAGSVMVVMAGGRDIFFYRDCVGDANGGPGAAQLLFSYTLRSNAAGGNATLRDIDGATCAAAVMSADDTCQVRTNPEKRERERERESNACLSLPVFVIPLSCALTHAHARMCDHLTGDRLARYIYMCVTVSCLMLFAFADLHWLQQRRSRGRFVKGRWLELHLRVKLPRT